MRRLLLLAGVWFAVDSALAKYDLGPVTAAAAAAAPRPSRAPMASSIAGAEVTLSLSAWSE